jgi:hypothetical protein
MTAAVPLAALGNGPAFSASLSTNQSITTSTVTKVNFNTEDFDTDSAYNNTGSTVGTAPSYSFNPQVAGYYQINGSITSATATSVTGVYLYKNGAIEKGTNVTSSSAISNISALVYLNGSTDYVDCRAFLIGTTPAVAGGQRSLVYFQAAMVRGA